MDAEDFGIMPTLFGQETIAAEVESRILGEEILGL